MRERPKHAVLASVQQPGVSDAELASSLDELARLAETLGLEVVGRITQRRPSAGAAAVLGSGKLKELARYTGGTGRVPPGASRRQKGAQPNEEEEDDGAEGAELVAELEAELAPDSDLEEAPPAETGPDGAKQATVVIFDHDLTPSQLRNLEAATGAEVLDRSSVILAIFQRHARTREARLQVEIARLNYLTPRLREARGGADRQRGGIGGKGAGESALELDRRRVRDRIAELRQELVALERDVGQRRSRRSQLDTVALVGYTNAGKSSLMRALTGSEVLVEDQLFATLDTATRVLQPLTHPRILVSDTVGFIKKLPHDLVASFRSTLEEARGAALLLHVVDAADPAWRSQLEVTRTVLGELDAGENPTLVVLNKADRLDPEVRRALAEELPDALIISAKRPEDVAALRERILGFFERDMVEGELFVPYRAQRLVHATYEACRVLGETHEETGTRLRVRAPAALLEELRQRIDAEASSGS
ncbi:MAG: GTPase HflX [Deltaproteobacteria bacterium]|nr:GTPase HflX [Deltaproteobacteria bacterium]